MRVLVVHNAYQYKGGEDSVVDSEMAMLANKGHSVELFQRHNIEIEQMGSAAAAAQTLWSSESARSFEELVRSFKADVVHVHNTFPLISPSIYWVADRLNVPVIQTLHNFRLLCPQAMFLRKGKVCEDCLGKLPWRGAVRGCYRNSKLQSTLLAGMVSAHKVLGTWQNKVTRYIALNEFCRNKFIAGGLPPERIVVKPNFVDYKLQLSTKRSGFVFVGRLSMEKGIGVLTSAMSLLKNVKVRVGGDGPNASALDGVTGVVPLGNLSRQDVQIEMNRALAVLVPSVCYETFGLVVVEAFASGTPVIASRIGVLPSLVKPGETGLLFESGDPTDLARKMDWARQHPEEMAEMGRNARALYEAEFTAEQNYIQLVEIYQSAIKEIEYKVKP